MFEDWSWILNRTMQQQARLARWLQGPKRVIVIEVGAGTAISAMRRKGKSLHTRLVRINLQEAEV